MRPLQILLIFAFTVNNAISHTINKRQALSEDRWFCDFETDICGMKHESSYVKWTRHAGRTTSADTGPDSDHTQGTNEGHYIYLETSDPAVGGDKARITLQINQTELQHCLSFYYHMHGEGIGDFNVETGLAKDVQTVFSKTGDQGNEWHLKKINMPIGSYLTFEATKARGGRNYLGDIALDDISLTVGECSSKLMTVDVWGCDFEKITWDDPSDETGCGESYRGMTQLRDDNFDFTRLNKQTQSKHTGPFTGIKGGHFAYTESSPVDNNDRRLEDAVIRSPRFGNDGVQKLSFFYHTRGLLVGGLRVVALDYNLKIIPFTYPKLDMKSSVKWKSATFALPKGTSVIEFHVTLPDNEKFWSSDIAIDEVLVTTDIDITTTGIRARPTTTEEPVTEIVMQTKDYIVEGDSLPVLWYCTFERLGWEDPSDSNGCGDGQSGMEQLLEDDFNFTRTNKDTPSRNTGPSSGSDGGYFVYSESSVSYGIYDRTNKVAIIRTPQMASGLPKYLSFKYHTFGDTIGTLTIRALSADGSILQIDMDPLSMRSSQIWKMVEDIELPVGTATVEFVVVLRNDETFWTSDIALDEIYIKYDPGTVTEASRGQPSFSCDFDSGICDFLNDESGDLNWTRNSGSTASFSTGPSRDHTSRSGSYVYLESSTPAKKGDKARFRTPLMDITVPTCFTMFYHMYGLQIGTLSVRIPEEQQILWDDSGNKGNEWLRVQIPLPRGSYVIDIEGEVGDGYLGDIAFDDVDIQPGKCNEIEMARNLVQFDSKSFAAKRKASFPMPITPYPPTRMPTTARPTTVIEDDKELSRPVLWYCTFEKAGWDKPLDRNGCGEGQDGMFQLDGDDFDFSRTKKGTPSVNTGPFRGSDGGYYIYAESSADDNLDRSGERATIRTPTLYGDMNKYLSFKYHTRGQTIGSLTLATISQDLKIRSFSIPSLSMTSYDGYHTTFRLTERAFRIKVTSKS
ncbi:unnamed protein product [Owenia fusiformis]|uniref:MAM domain-containing protein n=1 Tax=Owenia fusiformis TaxID=6347 RepID=A0A8S4NJ20_OWEFU|nr:unnamed protein product [Owenia fusiformis]